jgi:hypothetical protein
MDKEDKMNEWKELKKDNLPPDILTGDYEFGFMFFTDMQKYDTDFPVTRILAQLNGDESCTTGEIYYRKIEKPAPTHEEIMTKWWLNDNNVWRQVESFDERDNTYYIFSSWEVKRFFNDLKSADIPPEAL